MNSSSTLPVCYNRSSTFTVFLITVQGELQISAKKFKHFSRPFQGIFVKFKAIVDTNSKHFTEMHLH